VPGTVIDCSCVLRAVGELRKQGIAVWCHILALVVTWINELGVKVQHIPGGCTGLCQPVDIRVAKLLKDEIINGR